MAHWVIQENVRDEASYGEFLAAVGRYGIEHTIVKVVPFSHETIPDLQLSGSVLVWGSTSLDLVAKRKGWTPGTFLNSNFDQRIWSKAYGSVMLNADAEFFEFCKIPAYEGSRFIRPVEDMKVFAGTVIDGGEVERWKDSIQQYSDGYTTLRAETMVSVSVVKEIASETRFFVVAGRVVAGSLYRLDGRTHYERRTVSERADWRFAQRMVDLWCPADAFVIDVAAVSNDGFRVIEVNCINSAGYYDADMDAVVKAVHDGGGSVNYEDVINQTADKCWKEAQYRCA